MEFLQGNDQHDIYVFILILLAFVEFNYFQEKSIIITI